MKAGPAEAEGGANTMSEATEKGLQQITKIIEEALAGWPEEIRQKLADEWETDRRAMEVSK